MPCDGTASASPWPRPALPGGAAHESGVTARRGKQLRGACAGGTVLPRLSIRFAAECSPRAPDPRHPMMTQWACMRLRNTSAPRSTHAVWHTPRTCASALGSTDAGTAAASSGCTPPGGSARARATDSAAAPGRVRRYRPHALAQDRRSACSSGEAATSAVTRSTAPSSTACACTTSAGLPAAAHGAGHQARSWCTDVRRLPPGAPQLGRARRAPCTASPRPAPRADAGQRARPSCQAAHAARAGSALGKRAPAPVTGRARRLGQRARQCAVPARRGARLRDAAVDGRAAVERRGHGGRCGERLLGRRPQGPRQEEVQVQQAGQLLARQQRVRGAGPSCAWGRLGWGGAVAHGRAGRGDLTPAGPALRAKARGRPDCRPSTAACSMRRLLRPAHNLGTCRRLLTGSASRSLAPHQRRASWPRAPAALDTCARPVFTGGERAGRTCARRAAGAVHEQLGLGREVEVDDVVQQRDVQAARGHVGHDQHAHAARAELADVDPPRRLRRAPLAGIAVSPPRTTAARALREKRKPSQGRRARRRGRSDAQRRRAPGPSGRTRTRSAARPARAACAGTPRGAAWPRIPAWATRAAPPRAAATAAPRPCPRACAPAAAPASRWRPAGPPCAPGRGLQLQGRTGAAVAQRRAYTSTIAHAAAWQHSRAHASAPRRHAADVPAAPRPGAQRRGP